MIGENGFASNFTSPASSFMASEKIKNVGEESRIKYNQERVGGSSNRIIDFSVESHKFNLEYM